jgi:hypothetical protein
MPDDLPDQHPEIARDRPLDPLTLDRARRIAATEAVIREACMRDDVPVTANGAISERDAARALGYRSSDGLRHQATEGTNRIPFFVIGNRRFYKIHDLAAEMERTSASTQIRDVPR